MPGACEVDGGTPTLGVAARSYDSKRQHGHLFTEVRAPPKIFDYKTTHAYRFIFNHSGRRKAALK